MYKPWPASVPRVLTLLRGCMEMEPCPIGLHPSASILGPGLSPSKSVVTRNHGLPNFLVFYLKM